MRLIIEAENSSKLGKEAPEVPQIPSNYSQLESSGPSPQKEESTDLLTLLPSTVYQPPQKLAIPRSMSAPIPDEPGQVRYSRKASAGEIRGIEEVIMSGRRRRSQEEPLPPPPPPAPSAPPMLKELQHLAIPPLLLLPLCLMHSDHTKAGHWPPA